jgi:hypothetical protein
MALYVNESPEHHHLPLLLQGSMYHVHTHQQSFQEVDAAGTPVYPLDFPTPVIYPSVKLISQTVVDHRYHSYHEGSTHLHTDVNLICRTVGTATGDVMSDTAYWIKKQVAHTTYGTVQFCVVVRRRSNICFSQPNEMAEWTTTDETVAIKISSMLNNRKNGEYMHVEDPLIGKLDTTVAICLRALALT